MATLERKPSEITAENVAAYLRALKLEKIRRHYMGEYDGVEWAHWLVDIAPGNFTRGDAFVGFSPYHIDFWEWVYQIEPRVRPDPFIAIWPRFGGKSTNLELTCVNLACRGIRRYFLYICATQSQADDHIGNISAILESPGLARRYPQMANRLLSKHGQSKGWRINRLRTAAGVTFDGIGLDKAMRGAKLEEQRPDFMGFDDLDELTDSQKMVLKKEGTLSKKILPAGAENLAVVGAQNLIHANGIFARMLDGRSELLSRRKISGPFPALEDFTYEQTPGRPAKITGGRALWAGLSLPFCQEVVDDIGVDAFLAECQHEKELSDNLAFGGVWRKSIHVFKPFLIPQSWTIDRAFDWGSSKPFAVLWFAESDGETPATIDGKERRFPKGTLFVIAELYGWTGKPNVGAGWNSTRIAEEIKRRESGFAWGARVKPGPADIPDAQDDEDSIEKKMAKVGIKWAKINKGPGSRVAGLQLLRDSFQAALSTPIEEPALFLFDTCLQCLRTLPTLPRDPVKTDDVDTDAEDHLYDALKARKLARRPIVRRGNLKGA